MRLFSIDIGSTWTKGAAFVLSSPSELRVAKRASHPTTVDDLSINADLAPDCGYLVFDCPLRNSKHLSNQGSR